MRILFGSLITFAFIVSLNAQSPTAPKTTVITSEKGLTRSGAVSNGVFMSQRYGVSLPIPAVFTVVLTAENKILNEAGLKLLKSEGKAAKGIERAEQRADSLLVISAKPLGSQLNSVLRNGLHTG